MISRKQNKDLYSTQQQAIEDFKKFLAAETLSATFSGLGNVKTESEVWDSQITISDPEPQSYSSYAAMGKIRRVYYISDSPLTSGTDLEKIFPPPSESPFDTLDELREEDEKVLEFTYYVRGRTGIGFASQLADRLEYLFEVAKEENPDEVAISVESLRSFVSFLQSAPYLRYPDVVLSPSKNIRVEWRRGPKQHFAVEFHTTGDAQFVIFSPDPNYPERTIRLTGLVSVESLIETVSPHGVLAWSS